MEGRRHLPSGDEAQIYSRRIVRSLWTCTYVDWTFLAFGVASRGVLVMWDSRVVEKLEFVGEFIVACSFISVEYNFLWAFVGVFGPNLDNDKSILMG